MTKNQKIAIAIGSGLVGAYALIFVYQRIQRAKADKNVTNSTDAIKLLRQKKVDNIGAVPDFSAEDSIPQVPNPDESVPQDTGYIPDSNLSDVQQWDVMTGMGDYSPPY